MNNKFNTLLKIKIGDAITNGQLVLVVDDIRNGHTAAGQAAVYLDCHASGALSAKMTIAQDSPNWQYYEYPPEVKL